MPFVDSRCESPIEEIQAVVDGTISTEQAVCPDHINELENHQAEIERKFFRINNK